ncbi:immunity 52 family protein (plasmid) [Xenorhabdus stockiae]|uniref:immunity 52 family protein n=1 Tax=Xenorhabdus stockiae TaxID=351614 RepID=UPI003CF8F702
MSFIFPRIKLLHDLKQPTTPELALTDVYQVIQQINPLVNSSSGWHLPGYTLEEIAENHVIDENGLTGYAVKQFEESFDYDTKSIIKSLFDTPGEVKSKNDIMYMSGDYQERLGKTNIAVNLSLEKENFKFNQLIDFVKNLVFERYSPTIMIETKGYSLKRKYVFPDRARVGWMIYLPIEIEPALIPMAEEILSIPDKKGKIGTLIITTKEIFDIENPSHINKANDIEICLRDLQALPLIAEI